MSSWTIVGLDNCLGWTNVWVGQWSGWTNVWLDNCPVGQTAGGQMLFGQTLNVNDGILSIHGWDMAR